MGHDKLRAAVAKEKTKATSAKAHEQTSKAAAKLRSAMQLKLRAAKVAAAKKAAATARKAAVLQHKQAVLRLKTLATRESSAKKAKTSREKASKQSSIAQLKAKLNQKTSALRNKLRKQRKATPAARRLKRMQRRSARKVRRAARAAHRTARRKLRRSKRKLRHMQAGADAIIRKTGRSDARSLHKQAMQKPLRPKPPTSALRSEFFGAEVGAISKTGAKFSKWVKTRIRHDASKELKKPPVKQKSQLAESSISEKSRIIKESERILHRTLKRALREKRAAQVRTLRSVNKLKKQKRALRKAQRVQRGHFKKVHVKPFVMPKLKKFTVPKHSLPSSVRHAYQKLKTKEEKARKKEKEMAKEEKEMAREEESLLSPFTVSYLPVDADKTTPATTPEAPAAVPIGLQGDLEDSSRRTRPVKKAKHSGTARVGAGGVWLPL